MNIVSSGEEVEEENLLDPRSRGLEASGDQLSDINGYEEDDSLPPPMTDTEGEGGGGVDENILEQDSVMSQSQTFKVTKSSTLVNLP